MTAEEVVLQYSDVVYKIAYRYVGNPTDAEDVYSETFLAYFRHERAFESEEHRKAWLIRVTINAAKDLLKSRGSFTELNEEITGEAKSVLPSAEVLALRSALEQLPEKQRELICLYYLHGLSVHEIAQAYEMNENTVKVTMKRARDKLRSLIGE